VDYKVLQRFILKCFCIKPNAFIIDSEIFNRGYVQDWNKESGLGNWIVQHILEILMVALVSRCTQETHVCIDVNYTNHCISNGEGDFNPFQIFFICN
jgi:hypothetical protein